MASCTGGGASSPVPLDPARIELLATELNKCVRKDQLVKAKFILKGLKKEEKRLIVSKVFDGNAPLFIAAQHGQLYFVNYLLEECGGDIEQRGIYEVQEDRSRHQVTPLWCAAVANKLEVVRSLIKHGADVNATSDTHSTPVRSACYMTNIEVVKYLVEAGADIHKPNINGGTCLINSVQSVDLCRFLIDKGADVNAQDNSGNLALHYAIREGRMETVKLLLKHGSNPYVKNDFGDDAIQTASLRGYGDILEHLIYRIRPSVARQVEAYELMATNFVDEKHDIQRAIQTWRLAMEMRFKDPENPIPKIQSDPNPAYLYAQEPESMDELDEIVSNPDSVYMQALLIRERILGPDHKDTIFGLMYRGAVYADTHRYQRCVDLWKYAFMLRHKKQESLNHECLFTLQALCKLFWEIAEEYNAGFTSEALHYNDVVEVMGMAIREVEAARNVVDVGPVQPHQQEEFVTLMLLLLHLIHLMSEMDKTYDQEVAFRHLVHQAIALRAKTCDEGRGLLHLALDRRSSKVSDEYYSHFPNPAVVELLIECGAGVNSVDLDGNTPLHVCAEASRKLLDSTGMKDLEAIIEILLKHGAHVDARNHSGRIAGEELSKSMWYRMCIVDHITLKCLAARAVKMHSIPYEGEVPQSLFPFIKMH